MVVDVLIAVVAGVVVETVVAGIDGGSLEDDGSSPPLRGLRLGFGFG